MIPNQDPEVHGIRNCQMQYTVGWEAGEEEEEEEFYKLLGDVWDSLATYKHIHQGTKKRYQM